MLPARGVRIHPAGEWPGCQESSDVNLSAPSVLPPLFDLETSPSRRAFRPAVVSTFEEAGLNDALVESLILKFLINQGSASGRRIATEMGLPFGPFPEFLRQLKNQQIVNYAGSSTANDFVYTLTDAGRARGKAYSEECTYVGTAPVPFEDYLKSVSRPDHRDRATQGGRPAAGLL